jgi:predicted signal transduction protein with EAL and GGDEF domain
LHNFGAVAVAEGVEFAADLRTISMVGCDKGQGYLLGRPMLKAELLGTFRGRERLTPGPDAEPTQLRTGATFKNANSEINCRLQ